MIFIASLSIPAVLESSSLFVRLLNPFQASIRHQKSNRSFECIKCNVILNTFVTIWTNVLLADLFGLLIGFAFVYPGLTVVISEDSSSLLSESFPTVCAVRV